MSWVFCLCSCISLAYTDSFAVGWINNLSYDIRDFFGGFYKQHSCLLRLGKIMIFKEIISFNLGTKSEYQLFKNRYSTLFTCSLKSNKTLYISDLYDKCYLQHFFTPITNLLHFGFIFSCFLLAVFPRTALVFLAIKKQKNALWFIR